MFAIKLIRGWNDEKLSSEKMLKVSDNIIISKEVMKNTLEVHSETGHDMLRSHLLYHVMEYLESFEADIF